MLRYIVRVALDSDSYIHPVTRAVPSCKVETTFTSDFVSHLKILYSGVLINTGRTFPLALTTVALLLVGLPADAQDYPVKPVRLVTDGSAGGGGDVLARIITAELARVLNQQIIVDNRPGAGGTLAPPIVLGAPADGHTLLQVTVSAAANVVLRPNLSYDIQQDFVAISQIASGPAVVVVHPAVPAKSIKALIALARARPGELNFASAGIGSSTSLAAELFKHAARVDLLEVAYKGGNPALVGVMTGEAAVSFSPLGSVLPPMRNGALRALAVSTVTRVPAIPDVPTVAEAGVPQYEFSNWYGWFARAGTPRQLVDTVHRAVLAVFKQPQVTQRLAGLGYLPVGSAPADFAAYVRQDVGRLENALRQAGASRK